MLTGYIKHGTTVGTITPDNMLLDASAIRNKNIGLGRENGVSSKTNIMTEHGINALGRREASSQAFRCDE
jgi:hypothetical protein